MNTTELITQHTQQLAEAEQLAVALLAEWEQAARSGSNCEALEERQDNTARLAKRLELRIGALMDQLQDEAEAQRLADGIALRAQVIEKYQTAAQDYAAIKKTADKLLSQLAAFNRAGNELAEVDLRQLKKLGAEPLPREVSQILTHSGYDGRAFDFAWMSAHHLARHGLEQAAHELR
jgi:uncharacterized protein YydD (DUF2326 family)